MSSELTKNIPPSKLPFDKEIICYLGIIFAHMLLILFLPDLVLINETIFFIILLLIEISYFTVFLFPNRNSITFNSLVAYSTLQFMMYGLFILIINKYFFMLFMFDTRLLIVIGMLQIIILIYVKIKNENFNLISYYKFKSPVKDYFVRTLKGKELEFILISLGISVLIRLPLVYSVHSSDVLFLAWQGRQILLGNFDKIFFDSWTLISASPGSPYPVGSVLLMAFNINLFPGNLEFAVLFYNVMCLVVGIPVTYKLAKIFIKEDLYCLIFSFISFSYPLLLFYSDNFATARFPAIVFINIILYFLAKHFETRQNSYFFLAILSWFFSIFLHRMNMAVLVIILVYIIYIFADRIQNQLNYHVTYSHRLYFVFIMILVQVSILINDILPSTLGTVINPLQERFRIPFIINYNLNYFLVYFGFYGVGFILFNLGLIILIFTDFFKYLKTNRMLIVIFIPFFIFIGRTDYATFIVAPIVSILAVVCLKYVNDFFKLKYGGLIFSLAGFFAYYFAYEIFWRNQGIFQVILVFLCIVTVLLVIIILMSEVFEPKKIKNILVLTRRYEKTLFIVIVFVFFTFSSTNYYNVQITQPIPFSPYKNYITPQVEDIVNFMKTLPNASFTAFSWQIEYQIAAYLGWPFLADIYELSMLLTHISNDSVILNNRQLKPLPQWADTYIFDVNYTIGHNIIIQKGDDLYRALYLNPFSSPISQYIIKAFNLKYVITDSSNHIFVNYYRQSTIASIFLATMYSSPHVKMLHENSYYKLWEIS